MLDNTFGRSVARWLSQTMDDYNHGQAQIQHIQDRFDASTPDDIWVPKLLEEDWIIISADLGRRGEPKLHYVCRECKVPLVEIAPGVARAGTFEFVRALLYIWPFLNKYRDSANPVRCRISYASNQLRFTHRVTRWQQSKKRS